MIPRLEARLAELAALNQTITCGQLAREMGLSGPATIARLSQALESLMEDDAAQNRPLRAALLAARGSALPAPGFFQKAAALSPNIQGPAAFITDQRQALHLGANTPQGSGGVKPPAPTAIPPLPIPRKTA